MKNLGRWLVLSGVAAALLLGTMKSARADDCLEIGWTDRSGAWTWYKAWVDDFHANGNGRVHIKYDYHHGELELNVSEHDHGDGDDQVVLRGKWFEGHDEGRMGKVYLSMEKGHHHAKGWYTYGDDESHKYDLALRDCKH